MGAPVEVDEAETKIEIEKMKDENVKLQREISNIRKEI